MNDQHDIHPDIAERNLERLLGTAYQPESADPVFVQAVEEYLCDVARDLATKREQSPAADILPIGDASTPAKTPDHVRRLRRRFGWVMAIAASLFLAVLFIQGRDRPTAEAPSAGPPPQAQQVAVHAPGAHEPAFGQTAQARPQVEGVEVVGVGEKLVTKPGQRRRVTLADGSVLYLNH